MPESLKVLIVEDSIDDCDLLLRELNREFSPVEHRRVDTRHEMIQSLQEPWDIVLSDFSMPHFSGMAALEILKASGADIPFIIVSGTIGEEAAVDLMRAGASDYVLKSKTSRLMHAIRRERQAAEKRTKLHNTEEQLRHMQKMEAVGQLAGGVAHDFNNMLSVVQIYCRKLKEIENPQVHYYVDKILSVQNRSVSLTKQLLIFSRKQSGTATVLNASQVLQDMQDMLQRLVGESVELAIKPEKDLFKVKADRGQLEQVIMNLTVNARDALPDGGRIILKTSNVDFANPTQIGGELLSGKFIVIEASDNGHGIPKDILGRIFEPFFTTKMAKNGTGLGLSIIYGIIHQSGGEITVTSDLGRGTTFKIYLPETTEVEKIEITSEKTTPTNGGNEKILLVEDNYELRSLFAELLEAKGYDVTEAADGVAALKVLEQIGDQIHLVITDMIMPKIGGRELYRQALMIAKNIKFIYMSGYFEDSKLADKNSIESFYYLQKPFSEEALLDKVRKVLDS